MEEVLIVPPTKTLFGGRLFGSPDMIRSSETISLWNYVRNRFFELGFELKTIDQSSDIISAKAIVFFEMRSYSDQYYSYCIKNQLDKKMRLIAWEPPVIHPPNYDISLHSHFAKVLTWNDDLVDNKKYLKFHYVLPIREGQTIQLPRIPFQKKKLLCMISSNKFSWRSTELYSERIRAIRFMEKNHPSEFDLYGIGWDFPVIHTEIAERLMINAAISKVWPKIPEAVRLLGFPSYRGITEFKSKILPRYKFTISYENQIGSNGYVSEKILEAMLYGCVPIYLGDSGIGNLIPRDCFIDKREYRTYEDLYSKISSIGKEEHSRYLDNIEKFLNSEKVSPFTMDAFAKAFEALILS